jgi:uncharacterized protein YndB with AHSA1/START domain
MSAEATPMQNTGSLKVTTQADREILLTRVFDAPRSLVFDALTTPGLLERWLGPGDWSLAACEIDLRVGGRYRFVMRGPEGAEMGWGGVYREIVPPERIVHTEAFDVPWYPGEALITAVLIEQGGRTTLRTTLRYESKEAREAVLKTPMEHGLAESYDRLAELLASTQARARSPDRG